ncbi:MAG: Periplasmic binding protein [Candidatus Methanofastidiosum methylothiophilum]|uniref:Periplasmic binding protein n=1 Tax=Candidatus Methanofastidiosum methylothiophilum TaxID=1705564 RepID=A0A150IP28_9EURY|nr:MAG: Periplasmic binding protein [Candidatus Methanofastidiosum methylthiophilus]
MIKNIRYLFVGLICFLILLSIGCASTQDAGSKNTGQFRNVTDSRGVTVKVPVEINRVVTISDGLVEEVMTVLGEQNKIVGLGSACIARDWSYTYDSVSGGQFIYTNGKHVAYYLNPKLKELPVIADDIVNYEGIASLKPDVVIMRVGDCTIWTNNVKDEIVTKTITTIEASGIPLIVLYSPNCYETPDMKKLSDEILIIGSVFGKEEKARNLSNFIEAQVNAISERTKNIPEDQRTEVLIFGLSPSARKQGGAGVVFGTDTLESFFIEKLANAKNAYQDKGYFKTLSTEQILALNPDTIVLATAAGYHPPKELYEAPYYQNLKSLDAIKNKRVTAFPWTPCNCAKRLEYPIDVMIIAMTAYPDKFSDIDLENWLISFYQGVYGVDKESSNAILSAQWMDWVKEK